jgi:multiple sugar transport system permease protein
MTISTSAKKPRTKRQADRLFASLLMSPSLFVILVVCIFPLVYGVVLSFYKYELALTTPLSFVGFQNYLRVLNDPKFWSAVKISAITVVAGAAIQLVLGFSAALVVNRSFRGRSAIVSILLLPTTIAPVVIGFVFRMIFDDRFGPLNYLLHLVGLPPVPWLANPTAAVAAIVLANGWEWYPFVMLVILAGLQSVPQELTDAAMVDGASGWNLFWRIILPLLQPIVIVVVLIRAIEDLKLFDIIYVMTGGGPGIATQTMNMYAYQRGFSFFSIGYASALSYVQLILTLIMVRALFSRLSR